jgi:hypothetical protein
MSVTVACGNCGLKEELVEFGHCPKCKPQPAQADRGEESVSTMGEETYITMPINETIDIPITTAKIIAFNFGYDQVIIIGRKCGKGGREHCTTYGVNKEHCDIAARCGNFLKYKVMGWVSDEEKKGGEV